MHFYFWIWMSKYQEIIGHFSLFWWYMSKYSKIGLTSKRNSIEKYITQKILKNLI